MLSDLILSIRYANIYYFVRITGLWGRKALIGSIDKYVNRHSYTIGQTEFYKKLYEIIAAVTDNDTSEQICL